MGNKSKIYLDKKMTDIRTVKMSHELQDVLATYHIAVLEDVETYPQNVIWDFVGMKFSLYEELKCICEEYNIHIYNHKDIEIPKAGISFTPKEYTIIFGKGYKDINDIMKAGKKELSIVFAIYYPFLFEKLEKIFDISVANLSSSDKVHENELLSETSTDKFILSSRLRNILISNNIYDLRDLSGRCKADICKFRNMGNNSYNELKQLCDNCNIHIYSNEDIDISSIGIYFTSNEYDFLFKAGIRDMEDIRKCSKEFLEYKINGKRSTALIKKILAVQEYIKASL